MNYTQFQYVDAVRDMVTKHVVKPIETVKEEPAVEEPIVEEVIVEETPVVVKSSKKKSKNEVAE